MWLRKILARFRVAPYAGAWIEIPNGFKALHFLIVAPYAGAWIEMDGLEKGINAL